MDSGFEGARAGNPTEMGEEDQLIAERYRLVARLGRGGMSEVWQAYDERLHRKVAVKQLLMPAGLTGPEAAAARARVVREARLAAQLQHRNVIAVFDVIEQDSLAYLIMEYLPSRSLAQVLGEQGTLLPDEVARIGAQIADGLAAAHAAGIVHRDVKPGNVLLGDDGTAKIADFGISRATADVSTTSSGLVVGTPAYISPEVAKGERATFASDVFSLGATLCTAVDGKPPVGHSDNAMALLYRAASGEISPPSQAGPMTAILERMLSADPVQRPRMAEVRDALAALPVSADQPTTQLPPAVPADPAPDPQPRRRRKAGLVAALVAVLLVAGGIITLLWNRSDGTDPAAAPPPATQTSSVTSSEPAPPPPTTASPTETRTQTSSPPPAGTPPPVAVSAPAGGAAVITDYYALMPGNLQEAWTRLTPKYQQSPAGGRAGYQRFWDRITSARVSAVDALSTSVVEATVEYRFRDGRVVVERHRYTLIQQDGRWKIDESTVLSSRTVAAG